METTQPPVETPEQPAFDFEAVFQVDDYMYFYSDMLTPEGAEKQVSFLVQELELNTPMKILDLACGFGRHANRLAALGHRVTGIDLTEGFLELARQDAAVRGAAVDYRQGDMRQLDDVEAFDRVLLIFTAFGYFDDEQNLLVLKNIAHALKPGGLLIIDTQNRDTYLKGYMPDRVTEKEGNLMIDRHTFDSLTGRLYNRRIVIRNGVRRDKPFSVRLYNPCEMRDLLHLAGLEIWKSFGGWDGQPISTESRRMIIIARKPATSDIAPKGA
ncbi:MAG: class I SAM-dependent methyltransferase [Anaerolineales bacterium]|nr:class I SAM-dependent methyltransferase [Anaerolineales bacterium]